MKSFLLTSLAAAASTVTATDLLLPLYNAPGTAGADWASVSSALTAHPNLPAKIVINVDSGPGTGAPSADWIAGGQSLADLSNVALLGYVPINRSDRALADAEADVAAWASWTESYGVAIKGIFVDEAPNTECDTCVEYVQSLISYIRDTAGLDVVVLNPGFPSTVGALDGYYALGPDFVVALETCFAVTSNGEDLCTPAGSYEIYDSAGYGTTIDNTLAAWVGTEYYAETAILIHGFHDTNGLYDATTDVLSSELSAVKQRGIGAAVFTTNHWITPDAAPADIATVVAALDAVNGSKKKC